jgi:hypothetical protein
MRSASLQHGERFCDFALEAIRLFVDDKNIRIEGFRRMLDNRSAHGQRLLRIDMQAERGVFAIAQLDNAGNTNEIHTGLKIEAPDNWGTGQN